VKAQHDMVECLKRKKFVKNLGPGGRHHLLAMNYLAEMALAVWDGKKTAYTAANDVSHEMVESLSKRIEFRSLNEGFVREAHRKDQLNQTLHLVDIYDAWTTELELG